MEDAPVQLVADLGGTNLRVARLEGDRLTAVEQYACRNFSGIEEALRRYLRDQVIGPGAVLCLAVASPVQSDVIQMTNLDWRFSQRELQAALELRHLLIINDYTAIAMSLPFLPEAQRRQVGGGAPRSGAPIAVCGPGTGLGVAHLAPHRGGWLVLAGEGGHVDFAPADEVEQRVLDIFRRRYGHVSAERILSGPGLVELHQALAEIEGRPVEVLRGEEISQRGITGECAHCRATLERFCTMLGGFCGNLALTLATFGGVYIAGGIIPDFLDFFAASGFRRRFEDKGRYEAYNAAIPTFVLTAPQPGLDGAAAYLRQHFATVDSA